MPVIRFKGRTIPIKNKVVIVVVLCLLLASIGLVGRLRSLREAGDASGGASSNAEMAAANRPSKTAKTVRAMVRSGLKEARYKEYANDPYYFADGVWHNGHPLCVRCNVGPAVVAAALGKVEGDKDLIDLAIATIDPTIRRYQMASGAVGSPAKGEDNPDIQTMSFAGQLGLTLYILGDNLDPGRRAAWSEALRNATEFLISNGNYSWYTNGNITLGNAMVAALAWKVTGDARYRAVYENALAFAQQPPSDRWPGRGLIVTRQPGSGNGVNGAAYLTEATSSGKSGFDADYTQVQADIAAVIAWVTDDPAAVRLANLLVNQLLPMVDRRTWLLNTSRGSRHPENARTVPFATSALTILAARGRTDLAHPAALQARTTAKYLVEDQGEAAYKMWGSRLGPLLVTLS